MNKLLITLLMAVSLSGCATDSTAMNDYEQKLKWADTADAEKDAQAALEKLDFRFMAMPLRNTVIPGVEPQKTRQYELRCGIKLIDGVTDTVRSEEQLRLMKKAFEYAAKYNAIIKQRCIP